MKRSLTTLFTFLFFITIQAQEPAKEWVLKKSDAISVDRGHELFRIIHRSNYSLAHEYYNFDFRAVDTATVSRLNPDWFDLQDIQDEKQIGRMYFEEVTFEGQKCLLNRTYRMFSGDELIGYYAIHYFSKEKAYTSIDQLTMVITTFSVEGYIKFQRDFPFSEVYKLPLDALPSNAYFLKNVIDLGNEQWMIDTYAGLIFLDEEFKVTQKYKWGDDPTKLDIPDTYKYIFNKWNKFAAENEKLLSKKCIYGPTACGVADRVPKGWTNYYVYNFGGRNYVHIEFFEEAWFAEF